MEELSQLCWIYLNIKEKVICVVQHVRSCECLHASTPKRLIRRMYLINLKQALFKIILNLIMLCISPLICSRLKGKSFSHLTYNSVYCHFIKDPSSFKDL